MAFDFIFTQQLTDFGRGLAAGFVGQPFVVYRLNPNSNGNVLDPTNIVVNDQRAKVTHGRSVEQMENEYLHTNAFIFLMDSSQLQVGDILLQNDPVYGANTQYALASKRPGKKPVCFRVESTCTLWRPSDNRSSYSGPTKASMLPFRIINGSLALGTAGQTPAQIPMGVQTIGQLKNQRPERLPDDVITTWWFIYVPMLAGLDILTTNDVIEVVSPSLGVSRDRYRINTRYASKAGSAGYFLACEKLEA